jgi:enamine deaminase RidA (YjgF/YER057c/UK114 family)
MKLISQLIKYLLSKKRKMETKKTIYQLHEEHKTWLNKLLFYSDEIKIMDKRISEVAEKNTSSEVRSLADHFNNQLTIKKEQIDILTHDINSHELYLEATVHDNPNAINNEKFLDHKNHRESIAIFEKLFKELREELIEFLSKWM